MSDLQIEDVSPDTSTLVLHARFENALPDRLFAYFTQAGLLIRWWPQEAMVQTHTGGELHLAWPALDWHLRGTVVESVPGRTFSFTWNWDHEPDLPQRTVRVSFDSGSTGARLRIEHGRYGSSEVEQADRTGHAEGWIHFLQQLAQAYEPA